MRNRLQREEQYEKDTMCCCSDYGIALLHRVYRKRSAALSFPGELNNKIRQVFGVWFSSVERLVRLCDGGGQRWFKRDGVANSGYIRPGEFA